MTQNTFSLRGSEAILSGATLESITIHPERYGLVLVCRQSHTVDVADLRLRSPRLSIDFEHATWMIDQGEIFTGLAMLGEVLPATSRLLAGATQCTYEWIIPVDRVKFAIRAESAVITAASLDDGQF